MVIQQIILGLMALTFVGWAAWLFTFRNRPEELNERLPLLRKQRLRRLHPLFQKPNEVWALALLFFGLGVVLFRVLIAL